MRTPSATLAVAAVGFAFAASVARGQQRDALGLVWEAPAGCPAAERVRASIDALLGGRAAERLRGHLHVNASVEHVDAWRVTLDTISGGGSGHRTIEASSCEGLANATALIVALMIDPVAVAVQGSKPKERPPAPAASPPSPEEARPPASRSSFGLLGAGAASTLGILPAIDAGVTAHAGLARRWLRVELQLFYGLRRARSEPSPELPGAYGEFSFRAGTLRGCWVVSQSSLALGPCAVVEAGLLLGRGIQVREASDETTSWLAFGAGGVMVLKVTPWLRLPVRVDVLAPVLRSGFVFRNVQTPIFRAWPVGARLAASAELRF